MLRQHYPVGVAHASPAPARHRPPSAVALPCEPDSGANLVALTLPDPDGEGAHAAPVCSYGYDILGNITNITDPLERETQYEYDALSRLLVVTNALAGTTSYTYDAANQRTSVTDELGRRTDYEYDGLGRLKKIIEPDPDGAGPQQRPETAFGYNSRDWLTSIVDAEGGLWSFSYNARGQRTSQTDPLNYTTHFAYDAAGQLERVTDPLSRDTVYTRDNLGRVTRVTDELDQHTDYAYDAVGNLLSVTDPLNNTTLYTWDNLYRLIAQEDAGGGVTTYGYDLVGNLVSLTDPVGNTTVWVRDNLDRVIQQTNELQDSRYYVWDAVGNLIQYTDRNGRVIEYAYDALNRIVEEHWLDGQTLVRTLTFDWDAAGQLVAASDPDSAYAFAYDDAGRLIAVSNEGTPGVPTVLLEMTYDRLHRRTSLAATIDNTADFVTTYAWDAGSRITRIEQQGQQGGNPVAEKRVDFQYNALGQFTLIRRYNDLDGQVSDLVAESTFSYDALARLVGLEHDYNGGTIAYAWQYDAAGRIVSFVSPQGTSDYTYDATGQLVLADHDYQPDEAHDFDANGNRTTTGYQVGTNNRLLSDGVFEYQYDAEGNLVLRTRISNEPADDYVMELEWDHRNRLTRVVFKNNDGDVTREVVYTYDVFDRRIGKSIDWDGEGQGLAESIAYVYDQDDIVLAFDGTGSLTHRYLRGPPSTSRCSRPGPGRREPAGRRRLLGALRPSRHCPRAVGQRGESHPGSGV